MNAADVERRYSYFNGDEKALDIRCPRNEGSRRKVMEL